MKNSATWVVCCQLFIITPGFQFDLGFPKWPVDMAKAINQTLEKPFPADKLDRSIVNLSGTVLPGSCDNFILYDWSAYSSLDQVSVQDEKIINPLEQTVREKINLLYQSAGNDVDVHFIAHSRSVRLHCEVIRNLAKNGNTKNRIRMLKMTGLDPHGYALDAGLESNPGGIVDWTENYYQSAGAPFGEKIPGALNIDVTKQVRSWNTRNQQTGSQHSKVHDFYFGTIHQDDTGDPDVPMYKDPEIEKQRIQFIKEWKQKKLLTRSMLFGKGLIIEKFNGPTANFFNFVQGRSGGVNDRQPYTPKPVKWDDCQMNHIIGHALQLTPMENWVGAACYAQSFISGDYFTAEFTIHMPANNYVMRADGITFVILDANNPPATALGKIGGHIGYGGMNGLAVVFDSYVNEEYDEHADTSSKVWLRAHGVLQGEEFSGESLPESLNSGNPFRVRLTLNSRQRKITLRVYSYGADRTVILEKKIPNGIDIPTQKILGFTSATGSGAQVHIIDDIIITTSPQ